MADFRAKECECHDCLICEDGLCPGGYVSDGEGNPIEPPCCFLDDDVDIEKWVRSQQAYIRQIEDNQHKEYLAEAKKKEKNKITQERRRRSMGHVRAETCAIKQLQKRVQGNEAVMRLAETFQIANSMISGREIEKFTDKQSIEIQNDLIRAKIKEIEAIRKQKLKDFRKNQRNSEKQNNH